MLLPEAMRCDFAALKIPFLAIAADFYAMEQVVLDKGPLIPALAASAALPSLARPVVIGGRVLIDGGFVNPVPYDVVMDRADMTVAVDVTGRHPAPPRHQGAAHVRCHHRFDADPVPLHHARKAQVVSPRHLDPAGGRGVRRDGLFQGRGNPRGRRARQGRPETQAFSNA